MDIYNSEDIHNPDIPVWLESKQLILNYCYGHPESNLLLFPYSPVVNYVNHAPSAGGENGSAVANAKLQWSERFNTKEWLDKSPEELIRQHKRAGLAMELVALRDIVQVRMLNGLTKPTYLLPSPNRVHCRERNSSSITDMNGPRRGRITPKTGV